MESNKNIIECLTEATTYQMLKALRKLFAIILYHYEASMLGNFKIDFLKQCLKISKGFMKMRTLLSQIN